MAVEVWVLNILKIIFIIIGGHVAITKVVPLLNDFLLSFIKDKKSVDSFTSLLDIYILSIVGLKIVEYVLNIDNFALNYLESIKPGFEILTQLFSYLQWILLALIVVVALKNYKS